MADNCEILTKRLALLPYRVMTPELLRIHKSWLLDDEVTKYSEQRHDKKYTWQANVRYIKSFDFQTSFLWAILDKRVKSHAYNPWEDYYLGHLAAYGDPPNKSFELAIMLGEKSIWGQGYGLEAWVGATEWLLSQGARKLFAGCMAPNKGMLSVLGKAGYQTEGRRKDHFLFEDKPVDMILAARFQ